MFNAQFPFAHVRRKFHIIQKLQGASASSPGSVDQAKSAQQALDDAAAKWSS